MDHSPWSWARSFLIDGSSAAEAEEMIMAASVAIKAGQPLLLRYRVVAHDGPVPRDLLDALKFQ